MAERKSPGSGKEAARYGEGIFREDQSYGGEADAGDWINQSG
jgi:hypothetical protein